MKNTEKIPERLCLYCRKKFRPLLKRARDAKFCRDDHRGLFHKFGTLEYRRLLDLMVSELKRQAEEAAIAKLAYEDRVVISRSRKDAGKSAPGNSL